MSRSRARLVEDDSPYLIQPSGVVRLRARLRRDKPTSPSITFLGNHPRRGDTIDSMNTSLSYFLYLVWFVLWIVAIVDCAKSNNPNKVVWIVVIILLPFLGSILYFLLGRRNTWA